MSDAGFESFRKAVENYFKGRGETITWSPDFGIAVGPSGAQMGMGNLMQMCAKAEPATWGTVISEHFGKLEAALANANPDQPPAWEMIKNQLTIRLMPAEAIPAKIRGESVWRTDLEGVISMLAIDYPDTVMTVNRTSAVEWGMPDEELFKIALQNLATNFALSEPIKTDLKNGPLYIFSADHFFAASHVLLLPGKPELVGPYGTMIAIPTRHTLIVCPVQSFDIVHDIANLLNVAYKAEQDGPGSITNQLYFYRNGEFSRVVSETSGGQVKLTPPPAFQRVLEELSPPKEAA